MKMSSSVLLAGTDFRFGKKALGDAELLKTFGMQKGIEVNIFEDKLYGEEGRRLSSTWLREAAGEGDVELYSKLCGGKCFSYTGLVAHGKQLGRQLGFPTANIVIPEEKFVVRRGVYVSRVTLGGRILYGVSNVGRRPTVESAENDVIETFIFDFDEDIYGAKIKTEILSFLRPEQPFSGKEELAARVAADKEEARAFLRQNGFI
jgi:riboflavin kinase/FMN adenylyltransferase